MAGDSAAGGRRRRAHIDWLKLIEVSGPFLSVPVLTAEWPDLEPLEPPDLGRLRLAHRAWLEDPVAGKDSWVKYIIEELLQWWGDVSFELNGDLALVVPEHDTTIVPTFTLTDPVTGEIRLLGIVSDGSPLARVRGSDWPAIPADRLAQLCRARKVELGLVSDGRWWTFVWASPEGVTSLTTWDAISWPDASERIVLRAFISLLQRRRFFGVPVDRRLPALLGRSLDNQEELTERLGVQVRQAVEMLVAALGRAGVSSSVTAPEAYKGAVIVLMRVVFLLYAEAIGLLPADNELYAAAYSVGGLHEELESRVVAARGNEAELDHTFVAWHRLLALFTAIDCGIRHPRLEMQAYDGTLFDPKRHPWLPLTVDDRTVLHILRAVQTVTIAEERRTVAFSSLQVEQIGFVYEGLLSFGGYRATEVVVGLVGREGREAEVSLAALEAMAAAPDVASRTDLASRIAEKFKASGIGTPRAISAMLTPLAGDERAIASTKLYAVSRDRGLAERLLPWYRLIRHDLRDDPVVILPGQLYVTESTLRAATGTHYTPAYLAKEIAEGALEPLVYSPGPLDTADQSAWRLLPVEEILSLRVADIAMGSGAFLVAACRYLADRVVEAWSIAGNADASRTRAAARSQARGGSLDAATDPVIIDARRLVIEHCLYGVDINEMAVEMAKMSLWIISLDPARPFTFLDDKLVVGDSLLGITSVEQLEWMHLDPAAGRALHEGALLDFTAGLRDLLSRASARRQGLVLLPDDIDGVHKKRASLREVIDETRHLRRYANLLVGAALAGSVSMAGGVALSGGTALGRRGLWAAAAKHVHEAFALDRIAEAVAAGRAWLATDKPDGAFDREPLHWPLEFPEVFGPDVPAESRGFDAVIGNPPFLGGQKLTGYLGTSYREYLVSWIGGRVRGSADIVAYFFLRGDALLNKRGQAGLIATNTIAQGDTREVGLDQIVARGTEIRQAEKSKRWRSKSAAVEYAAVWTSRREIASAARRIVDGLTVPAVTAALDPVSRVTGKPQRLVGNAGISFIGSYVLGMGFTMPPERAQELIARNPRNADVLFPYLNGQDLNSRPDCSASRWVINFHDWPLELAKTYPELYAQVLREVKPERQQNKDRQRREIWWRFTRPASGLQAAIKDLDRVIAITRVSKVVMPVMVPTGQIMSEVTVVFATDDSGVLTLLSSALHYWWTIERASTLETRIRYTPSDVFETFPLSEVTHEMRELGDHLDTFRRDVMSSRQAGLTATYNLVHDPTCTDSDIAELRAIHRAIDEAVARAYGWPDLLGSGSDLGHGFHDTRQGTRYTIAPAIKQEILDRLLDLNHTRHAAEVKAGLHKKANPKRATSSNSGDSALF